ncbi:MAG: hypothetical protein U0V56_13210 [Actinomycetota bacterium]
MHVSDVERTAEGMIVFGDVEVDRTELADRFHRLAHAARRNRGFGDFWGHMLVARGAAEAMINRSSRSGTSRPRSRSSPRREGG